MKKIFILLNMLCLNACGVSSSNGVSLGIGLGGLLGNHVGIGTSVNIPLGGVKNQTNQMISEPVIYFDANGQVSDSAVKNGFRRQVLTKQNDGSYLVQDFYETGGAKRTDPMQLSSTQLHHFRATPSNGTLTVYTTNGNVMQQQTFKNNQLIK